MDLDRVLVGGLLEVFLFSELDLAYDLRLAYSDVVGVRVLGYLLLDRHLPWLHHLNRLQVSGRLFGQSISYFDF